MMINFIICFYFSVIIYKIVCHGSPVGKTPFMLIIDGSTNQIDENRRNTSYISLLGTVPSPECMTVAFFGCFSFDLSLFFSDPIFFFVHRPKYFTRDVLVGVTTVFTASSVFFRAP